MRIHKTEGIVLAAQAHGEADRLLRVFTRDMGKRSFVLKGIRKSRRRPQGAADPGTRLLLTFYEHDNRATHIVTELRIAAHCADIRDSMERICHLALMLETVDGTSGFDDPNPTVFEMISAAVAALAATDSPVVLSLFFLLHLLRIHGVLPPMGACSRCGKPYADFAFGDADLRPVCAACARRDRPPPTLFPASARELLSTLLSTRFSAINTAALPVDTALDLLFRAVLFIEGYYHIEIKSKKLLFSLHRNDDA
ncbi:MAG TPA: DNA repair protein RecO [Spirochaetota bacterium]|nr:DNA repair protein RecO [Spirochaetota bacterium]HNT10344.1 DNA repair protein RecO [Spirochaetota bacterium]